MVTVVMCIFVVMLVIMINAISMNQKIEVLNARVQELQAEIEKEQERAVKIEEFRKYTQTKGYVEEIAQQYFDFVYENEILFKQE